MHNITDIITLKISRLRGFNRQFLSSYEQKLFSGGIFIRLYEYELTSNYKKY